VNLKDRKSKSYYFKENFSNLLEKLFQPITDFDRQIAKKNWIKLYVCEKLLRADSAVNKKLFAKTFLKVFRCKPL